MLEKHPVFDAEGPMITDPKYGNEPSLRTVLHKYYVSSGIELEEAWILVDEYIENWKPLEVVK